MIKTTKKSKKTPARAKAVSKLAPVTPEPTKTEVVKAQPAPMPPVKSEPVRPPAPPAGRVSLVLESPQAKRVSVAGSFNEWNPEKTPLNHAGGGRWVADLSVKPGRHEYLFVVDGQWLPDPKAQEAVGNPFGGKNLILVVSE